VETLTKRGYRFIGDVKVENGNVQVTVPEHAVTPQIVPKPARRQLGFRTAISASLGLAIVGASLFGLDTGGWRSWLLLKLRPPAVHSLAVLPLQNLSGDVSQEYFVDGMTDGLITELSQIASIRVISRTSILRYKKTDKNLPDIARELNVDGIIEGTVQRSGDRVRVSAQLIHGPSDKHLWAATYEREARDIFALESEVTQDIAHQIRARLNSPGQPHPAYSRPIDIKALDAYLQGNYNLSLGPAEDRVRTAQKFIQQAIELDPNFAPAYMSLANSYFAGLQSSLGDRAKGIAAAEKAVALAPSSSDAHAVLGAVRFASWDWPSSEEELRKAIALNFGNVYAHESLCEYLEAMGRLGEDLNECQIAQELDPDSDHLSTTLEVRRQYEGAILLLRRLVERHPDDGILRYNLFRDYLLNGMPKEAVQELERSLILLGYPEDSARVHSAFVTSDYRAALRELAKGLEHLSAAHRIFLPRIVAEVYSQLGDKDRAFYWLEQGYERRDMVGTYGDLAWIKLDHQIDPLRTDPRFANLLHRMKLPPD
jgi:TolB-like protein/Flp pilus assembly protein TadD